MYMLTEDPTAGTMSITSETDSFTFPKRDGGLIAAMLDGEFPACPDCEDRDRPCYCQDDAEDEAPLDGAEQ